MQPWQLIQNPETKQVNIKFLVAFGKFYWTPGYNWLRRNDDITRLDAHSAHEVLIQVFVMHKQISSLTNGGWKTNSVFHDCNTNVLLLLDSASDNSMMSPRSQRLIDSTDSLIAIGMTC